MKTRVLPKPMKTLICAVWVAALAGACHAADFTADMVTKHGKMVVTGKIYRQGQKMREDMSATGQKQTMIVRPDKKVAWMLNAATKQYMEMPMRPRMDLSRLADDADLRKMATKKSLGTETVNGYRCEKSLYTFKNKNMGTMTVWMSKDLQWPVKSENKSARGAGITEFKNIKKMRPADSLFEIPKGYKKMAMPGGPGMPGMHGMRGMHGPHGMPGMPPRPPHPKP